MQTRELRKYCERRGWSVSGECLDQGISGAKEKRPSLTGLWLTPIVANYPEARVQLSPQQRDPSRSGARSLMAIPKKLR